MAEFLEKDLLSMMENVDFESFLDKINNEFGESKAQVFFQEKKYSESFLKACVDFSRKMTDNLKTNNSSLNIQNFIAFFEFAIAEIKIFAFNELKCNQKEDLKKSDMNKEIESWLISEDGSTKQEKLRKLFQKYWIYATEAMRAGLASRKSYSGISKDLNSLNDILEIAEKRELKFASIPTAVYHWRKYNFSRKEPITAEEFKEELNEIVQEKNYIEKSEFEFKEIESSKINIRVIIRKNRPVEIISCLLGQNTFK